MNDERLTEGTPLAKGAGYLSDNLIPIVGDEGARACLDDMAGFCRDNSDPGWWDRAFVTPRALEDGVWIDRNMIVEAHSFTSSYLHCCGVCVRPLVLA